MTYQALPIRGPFQGINSDMPPPEGPPNAFDDVLNFFVRKGRIQSRPILNPFIASAGGNPFIRYWGKFKDANANFHTFALANYNSGQTPAYMLTTGPPTLNPLLIPGLAAGQQGSSQLFTDAHIQNQIYFANGGYPLSYLDGSNAVQFAGDTPGTCNFLAVCANHLIQAYCIEPATGLTGSTIFPRRVRWSATNNPQEWNPATDFTAGFNDLLEVPDDITGLNTLGYSSFVWRSNGLTVMFPTGVALAPWNFSNYSLAPDGVGNFFPYSLATYTNWCTFVAQDNIYRFDVSSMTPIGGQSKKKIYADLAAASGDSVWGRIVPNFTLGFDFLCYMLTIPGPNVTWIYTFDDGQWVRFSSSSGYLTAARTVYVS
jgi:hypothetical protein